MSELCETETGLDWSKKKDAGHITQYSVECRSRLLSTVLTVTVIFHAVACSKHLYNLYEFNIYSVTTTATDQNL